MRITNCHDSIAILLCSLMLVALPTPGAAQDAAPPTAASGKIDGFDIVIVDGLLVQDDGRVDATLENVIDLLRAKHPDANIVVAPDVPSINIGDLKLRATDLRMELAALRAASSDQFTWEAGPDPFDPISMTPEDTADQQLIIVRPAPEPPVKLRVEAFSLAGYFASLPRTDDAQANEDLVSERLEELERMVDETVEIYNAIDEDVYGLGRHRQERTLSMRFHPGANLLILIGDPQSVEIAAKVVGALPHVQRSNGNQYLPYGGSTGFADPGMAGRGRTRGSGGSAYGGGGADAYGAAGAQRLPARARPDQR